MSALLHLLHLDSTAHLHQSGCHLLVPLRGRMHGPGPYQAHQKEKSLHGLIFREHCINIPIITRLCAFLNGSKKSTAWLAFPLEKDHDVSGASVDLLEIQRCDVTVEFESLGYGGIHLASAQVWRVLSDPKAVWTQNMVYKSLQVCSIVPVHWLTPCRLVLHFVMCFVPVCDQSLVPAGAAVKMSKPSHISETTAGLIHHLQGVGVQSPRHRQAKKFLHFSKSVIKGIQGAAPHTVGSTDTHIGEKSGQIGLDEESRNIKFAYTVFCIRY